MKEITIEVIYDDEAKVFVASSKDVPGLTAEGKTFDQLRKNVLYLIPELIKLNSKDFNPSTKVPVELLIQQREVLAMC